MIREIQAKSLISHHKEPDWLFGIQYTINLYRGCQHQCIYCDSRSECYQIEDFDHDVLVKVNAIELLEKELSRKRVKGTVGTGSMNDPYQPLEARYNLTGRALEVIDRHGFGVHVITKSDMVLRDIDRLDSIKRVHAMVSFTITTTDDELARILEPGAPVPSRRLEAMQRLAERGIHTGISMMPILPYIEDNAANITAIVEAASRYRAGYILPWLGMSMRDRQREYYYRKLDEHFPGLRQKYERRFGHQYGCQANHAGELEALFNDLCARHGIKTRAPIYRAPEPPRQLQLF